MLVMQCPNKVESRQGYNEQIILETLARSSAITE